MSKKLEQKQRRREAEEAKRKELRSASRRRNLITSVIALVIIGAVLALVLSDRQAENAPIGPASAQEAGCGEVEEFDEVSREHIEEGSQHEPYNSDPPTSGPHYSSPAEAQFFSSPVEPERVVHNLEHGQIVIWYQPDLPEETIGQLQDLVEDAVPFVLATPYSGGDSPIVLTAWQNSLSCETPSTAVFEDFRKQFQGQGPEKVVPPYEG